MQTGRGKSVAPKATTIALLVMVAAIVGVLVATIVLVVAPRPARAEHDSMYLICPDPTQEGNTVSVGVKRLGHRVVYAYFFTHHGWHTASPNDFTEYHGAKFETDSDERTLGSRPPTEPKGCPFGSGHASRVVPVSAWPTRLGRSKSLGVRPPTSGQRPGGRGRWPCHILRILRPRSLMPQHKMSAAKG